VDLAQFMSSLYIVNLPRLHTTATYNQVGDCCIHSVIVDCISQIYFDIDLLLRAQKIT